MKRILFDIETNGIDFKQGFFLEQVHTVLCILTKDLDTGDVFKFYDTEGLRELGTTNIKAGLKYLEEADELVGHNIIQFDIPILEKLFGFKRASRILDTLVLSRTLYTDRAGGHSLESYGERLGFPKLNPPGFDAVTPDLLSYCERDVELNYRVLLLLEGERKTGDWGRAVDLEHKIAEIIAEQERHGFFFHKKQAEQYVQAWATEIDQIDHDLTLLVGNKIVPKLGVKRPFNINGALSKNAVDAAERFNIDTTQISGPFHTFESVPYDWGSNDQQKKVLLELKWVPVALTKTGLPKIDESITSIGQVGTLLLRRNILAHRRSQVTGLIESCDINGRVHGGANTCGTNTARMRHSTIVNIPRVTSILGKEIRALFGVPPGKILAGYDAKQLELRILAHYIGSEEYNERVTTTDKSRDAHRLAAEAAGTSDRDLGKTVNYAFIYGAGDKKLGGVLGGGATDGARIRSRIYELVPGLERLVSTAKRAARKGYLIGLDGRKLYVRSNLTSPLNTLIQGGGAVFMKHSTVALDDLVKQYRLDAHKVIDMHDEAQWEIYPEDKEIFNQLVQNAFKQAGDELKLRCPQEADVKTGLNWTETH